MQTDPIGYKDQMNLYGYVGNDPVNKFDPTGMETCVASGPGRQTCTYEVKGNAFVIAGAVIGAAVWNGGLHTYDFVTSLFNESADTPPIPEGLVGSQEDDRAGPARGKRWNSGPLLPELGGTGNAEDDFDGPISEGQGGESRPDRAPGSRTAPNGATIRPGKPGEGPRIDIPEKENAPPETLHYPPPETEKNKR